MSNFPQLPTVALEPDGTLALVVEVDGKVRSFPMTIERSIALGSRATTTTMAQAAECMERQDALSSLEIEAGRSDRELRLVQGGRS